jgi:hypothetical protein
MADKESLTDIELHVQLVERTKHAMENYISWYQNAMSASPWNNTELNKKLLSYATKMLPLLSDLSRNLAKLRIWKTS